MSIESIDEHYLPDCCFAGAGHRHSALIKVSEHSLEYQKCRQIMKGNFVKNFIAVYCIENKYLKNEYEKRLNTKISYFGAVDEYELLHCTSKYNVRSIIENNLDPLRATRVKYGCGVSFSPDAFYANLQSSVDNGVHRAMFLNKVMVGKAKTGRKNAIPEFPYDTLMGSGGNVFVKYNCFEFYPVYVIFYTSYPVASNRGRRYLVK